MEEIRLSTEIVSAQENVEDVKARLLEEGREARNLIAYSLPLRKRKNISTHDKAAKVNLQHFKTSKKLSSDTARFKQSKRHRSASAGRNPQASLRARHWAFLFRNLEQAVDEIYETAETDESVIECKEAILMLERYTSDFYKLIEWLNLKWNYENTSIPDRPTSLAWEIRTSSPWKLSNLGKKGSVGSGTKIQLRDSLLEDLSVKNIKNPVLKTKKLKLKRNRKNSLIFTSVEEGSDTQSVQSSSVSKTSQVKPFLNTQKDPQNSISNKESSDIGALSLDKPKSDELKETTQNIAVQTQDKHFSTSNKVVDINNKVEENKLDTKITVTNKTANSLKSNELGPTVNGTNQNNEGVEEVKMNEKDVTLLNSGDHSSSKDSGLMTACSSVTKVETPGQLDAPVVKGEIKISNESKKPNEVHVFKKQESKEPDKINNLKKQESKEPDKVNNLKKQASNCSKKPDHKSAEQRTVNQKLVSPLVNMNKASKVRKAFNEYRIPPKPQSERSQRLKKSNSTPTADNSDKKSTVLGQQVSINRGTSGSDKHIPKKVPKENSSPELRSNRAKNGKQQSDNKRNLVRSATTLDGYSKAERSTKSAGESLSCSLKEKCTSSSSLIGAGTQSFEAHSWADRVRGVELSTASSSVSEISIQDDDNQGWEVVRRHRRPHGGSTSSVGGNPSKSSPRNGRRFQQKRESFSFCIQSRFEKPSPTLSMPSLHTFTETENVAAKTDDCVSYKGNSGSPKEKKSGDSHKSSENVKGNTAKAEILPKARPMQVRSADAKERKNQINSNTQNRLSAETFASKFQKTHSNLFSKSEKITEKNKSPNSDKTRPISTPNLKEQNKVIKQGPSNKKNPEVAKSVQPLGTEVEILKAESTTKSTKDDPKELHKTEECNMQPPCDKSEQTLNHELEPLLKPTQPVVNEDLDEIETVIASVEEDLSCADNISENSDTDQDILQYESTEQETQDILQYQTAEQDTQDILQYESTLSKMSSVSWADQMDAMDTIKAIRPPGRALVIHEKLSSPLRKLSLSEKFKRHQQKLAKAQELRGRLILEKTEKLKDIFRKIDEVNTDKERLLSKKRDQFERKMERAEEKRRSHLREIVIKAHDEENKAKEIAFINVLEAQNKLLDIRQQHESHESRLADMAEERSRKLEEKAAKEAAAHVRRKALEAERQARMQEIWEKRCKKFERIGQRQAEKREEMLEQAREKARDREERLSALLQAQQAKESELVKKIQQKQEDTARRHDENIEQIRRKALEFSILSYSKGSDVAPQIKRYETKKFCSICNATIASEVYLLSHLRSSKHQAALNAVHKSDVSREESGSYNVQFIVDAPANIDDQQAIKKEERMKSLKKRQKKIRNRMSSRAKSFLDKHTFKDTDETPFKKRINKCLTQITKLLSGQGSGPWPMSDVAALDKNLLDILRIIDKGGDDSRLAFAALDGFHCISQVLNLVKQEQKPKEQGTQTKSIIPCKSLNVCVKLFVSASEESIDNCKYLLMSNILCSMVDILLLRFGVMGAAVSDQRGGATSPSLILSSDPFAASIMKLLSQVLLLLRNEEADDIQSRLQDVVSYSVSMGVADKVNWFFSHIQSPVEGLVGAADTILSAMNLLSALTGVLSTSEADSSLKSSVNDPTQLLASFQALEACGVVSLLYGLLLHQGGRSPSPPASPIICPITVDISTAATTFLIHLAEVDLNAFQVILGGEGISLEFRHIASFLFWYCSFWPCEQLLHNIIILVGYFAVNNKENQSIIQSGETPSVLQQLCDLPWQYFSDNRLMDVLFPSLLACCLHNEDNMNILTQEMSFQVLEDYLNNQDGSKKPILQILKKISPNK